ncbi:MAG: LptF/LptG family permease [Candidatus Poribacteria bacterium]|nr:LptF/LptG family permease [Candidatus Poribacteria bacterium]
MKIISRYCLKEFIPPFLISLICFTCIILFDELFRLVKLFVKKGVSPLYLIESLLYVMPATVVLSIPMAALVAILLALGRLSTDSEIMAMRAHGIGFHQLMIPLLIATVILSVIDLALMEYVLPEATRASVSLKRDIQKHNPALILEEDTVMKELQTEGKLWMYESTDPKTERLQNVKIWDEFWQGQPRFTLAQSASLGYEDGNAKLTLYDGHTYEPLTDGSEGFRVTQFQEQQIALDFKKDLQRREYKAQHPQTMRIGELKTHIGKLETSQQRNEPSEYAINRLRYAKVEYYKKFALPFACLAFGIVGIPLGFMVKKNGRMIGFGIGLAVILLYYLLLQFGQNTGLTGKFHPALAMWFPNLVVAAFGIALITRMYSEEKLRTWRNKGSKFRIVVNRNAES